MVRSILLKNLEAGGAAQVEEIQEDPRNGTPVVTMTAAVLKTICIVVLSQLMRIQEMTVTIDGFQNKQEEMPVRAVMLDVKHIVEDRLFIVMAQHGNLLQFFQHQTRALL